MVCERIAAEDTSSDLHPDPTMVTTIEVDVEELWTKTVIITPSMRPQIGLLSSSLLLRTSPAVLPKNKNERLKRNWDNIYPINAAKLFMGG